MRRVKARTKVQHRNRQRAQQLSTLSEMMMYAMLFTMMVFVLGSCCVHVPV